MPCHYFSFLFTRPVLLSCGISDVVFLFAEIRESICLSFHISGFLHSLNFIFFVLLNDFFSKIK